jgi:hypothetical protein
VWTSLVYITNSDIEPLIVMVEGLVLRLQRGKIVAGYEAWFDGKKDLVKQVKLPPPSKEWASLFGCYDALGYCINEYAIGEPDNKRNVLLATDNEAVYLALNDKKLPANCTVLGKRLWELCQELPVHIVYMTYLFACS